MNKNNSIRRESLRRITKIYSSAIARRITKILFVQNRPRQIKKNLYAGNRPQRIKKMLFVGIFDE